MTALAQQSGVGQTPSARAQVGLSLLHDADSAGKERVQRDPRGPGGPHHQFRGTGSLPKSKWRLLEECLA